MRTSSSDSARGQWSARTLRELRTEAIDEVAQNVQRALFGARLFDLQARQEEREQGVGEHVTCAGVSRVRGLRGRVRTDDLEAAQQLLEVVEQRIVEIAGQTDELVQQREDVGQVRLEHGAVVARGHAQNVVEPLRDGQVLHVLLLLVHVQDAGHQSRQLRLELFARHDGAHGADRLNGGQTHLSSVSVVSHGCGAALTLRFCEASQLENMNS